MQDPQNINYIVADLVHHNVIRVHNLFMGASHATGPEQIRHERQTLDGLNDGGVKILRSRGETLLYVIDVSTKSVVASSAHQIVCTGFAAFF